MLNARSLLLFRPLATLLLSSLVLLMWAAPAAAELCGDLDPWINEIDYDDDYNALFNWDRGEFIEIAGPAGLDLAGYRVVMVEGSNDVCWSGFGSVGNAYFDRTLPAGTVIDDDGSGIGFLSICLTSTSTLTAVCDVTINGVAGDSNLKNGSLTAPAGNCPDGLLIFDPQGNLVDSLGWEGQVHNAGAFGAYFQPPTTNYYLYPPIFDDGWGMNSSVARNDSVPARANSVFQWEVTPNGGATPSSANAGQALSCETSVPQICGNGAVEGTEECDDGNTTPGDGCSDVCVIEVCGDGILQAGLGEQCDDGNLVAGDGCSATCQDEACGNGVLDPGEFCDDGNDINEDGCSDSCVIETCGDGIPQQGLGEECDDGNQTPGDGCDALCGIEYCGDGIVQAGIGEQCDDGNGISGDGCSSICTIEVSECGNGVVEFDEQCDDGNLVSGDGCSDLCVDELTGLCGDGIVHPSEDCDDGGTISGDGCSSTCTDEPFGVCGDGVLHPTEDCEDGNLVSGDGCSASCLDEPTGVCGDGVLHPTEECDDGALVSGDGCSDLCFVEPTGVCGDGVVHPTEACDDGNSDPYDGCLATCELSNAVPGVTGYGTLILILALIGAGYVLSVRGGGLLRRSER